MVSCALGFPAPTFFEQFTVGISFLMEKGETSMKTVMKAVGAVAVGRSESSHELCWLTNISDEGPWVRIPPYL